jgi:peptide methionine sulfoxide reductase msrA/msrB
MIAEIVFAAGCFWGVEKHFESLPGVIDVKSGYTGGNYDNPTYADVLRFRKPPINKTTIINHTEAVKVKFDKTKITANKLIKSFWEIHDPTQVNRQGNDIGSNYRSGLFYTNENQKNLAYSTKATYQTLLNEAGYGEIVTEIKPLTKFWDAELNHQDYLAKNPNGYCPDHSTGVKFEKQEVKEEKVTLVKEERIQGDLIPIQGKEIIVVESEGYCPYCEKFKKEVSSLYKGTIPLRAVYKKQLKKYNIKTKLFATPTILFVENGNEVFAHRGFMPAEDFYQVLGDFKLGKDSESYNVAFNKGTDNRFCKEYDLFKNTPDGVFVDKLSGDPLFDTRDRFNSNTGWLSFYKSIKGSTIRRDDFSHGMTRVEVLAKKSGIHLGHVFPMFGKQERFCINATVLDFVPRDKIKK